MQKSEKEEKEPIYKLVRLLQVDMIYYILNTNTCFIITQN